MGAAKRRGTLEERQAEAISKQERLRGQLDTALATAAPVIEGRQSVVLAFPPEIDLENGGIFQAIATGLKEIKPGLRVVKWHGNRLLVDVQGRELPTLLEALNERRAAND